MLDLYLESLCWQREADTMWFIVPGISLCLLVCTLLFAPAIADVSLDVHHCKLVNR